MEGVIDFFTNAGWLANAATIFTTGLAIAIPLWRFRGLLRKPGFHQLIIGATRERLADMEVIKSIAKIAIVDDQLADFPLQDLLDDGYNIESYECINISDTSHLSQFDIVFLDMKGIVRDDPDYGGLRLIGELRELSPVQKICAVSGQRFDPTATDFFMKSDDRKKKPLTAQECKAVIENFLRDIFKLDEVIQNAQNALDQYTRGRRSKVVKIVEGWIAGGKTEERLRRELSVAGFNKEHQPYIVLLARMLRREA